jgi:hypothetical protein
MNHMVFHTENHMVNRMESHTESNKPNRGKCALLLNGLQGETLQTPGEQMLLSRTFENRFAQSAVVFYSRRIMARQQPEPGELTPYLIPEYWDEQVGQTLGLGGEARRLDPGGFQPAENRFARRAARLLLPAAASPPREDVLEYDNFIDGNSFTPEAYEPGSLTLFVMESLRGKTLRPDAVDELRGRRPLPERPRGHAPRRVVKGADGRQYDSGVYLGVVPEDKTARYVLAAPFDGFRQKGGEYKSPQIFHRVPLARAVGQTLHGRGAFPDTDELRRITALRLVTRGPLPAKSSSSRRAG